MTTPRGIHQRYRVRVDRINARPNMAAETRRALIAEAYIDARNQMRDARGAHRERTEPAPDNTRNQAATMSEIIRAAARRTSPDRARMVEAIAHSFPVPPELAGMQIHEIERLARDQAMPDTPEES